MEFPTLEISVQKKASEPIGVTLVLVTKSVGSLNDATVYADVSTKASNTNGLIINIVNSETTSLNQNGGDQANLWKIKVNVPNGVHYDVWFPLASVHDVTDQMKNSLYRYFAFGRHLEELHVTWDHLEKKQTRLRTYTNISQDYVLSTWRWRHSFYVTPSQRIPRRRHIFHDDIRDHDPAYYLEYSLS
ncbi:hypothetical protein Tco_1297913 [Tanacetum coccineum]